MSKRVILVRHGHEPPDDRVHTYCIQHGFVPDIRKPFAGEALDDVVSDDVAGTIVYGGRYNAFDTELHPFLNEEYRWIDACIKADFPLLGICQGAQMIAMHLGGTAGPYDEEVHEYGYYRVDPAPEANSLLPGPLWFTQAHYHTFSIPEGATHLASSELYPNQAFRFGDKVYGLQFHPEVTIDGFRRWQREDREYYGKRGAQSHEEQTELMLRHDQAQAEWFYGFLSGLLGRPDAS